MDMTIWWRNQYSFCHDPQCYCCSKLLAKSSLKNRGKGVWADIAYLYFQKISDKVPHQSLLKKLCCRGTRGNVLSQIKGRFKDGGQQQGSFPCSAGCHWGIPRYPHQACPKQSSQRAPTVSNYLAKASQDTKFSKVKLLFFFPGNLKATCGEVQEALVILKGKSIPVHNTMHMGKTAQVCTEISSEVFTAEKESSNCEKLVWCKWQPSSQPHPKKNAVKTDRECSKCFQKYSFHTKNCHTAWLPPSCRRGEWRDMTEVYKIMTSTEKALTKGANSCSISILLQEGGTAIRKRQVLEKQKEVLLPRICKFSGTEIKYMSSNIS